MIRIASLLVSFVAFVAAASASSLFTVPPTGLALSAGWPSRDCGFFRIQAPDATGLHRKGNSGGTLSDPRFTLSYSLGLTVEGDLAKEGLDNRERMIEVGGREAVLRRSEFPGLEAPYFLQLYVPHAVKDRHGRWLALEIHGWFANLDRRWLAEHIVASIDFGEGASHAAPPTRTAMMAP